MQGQHLIVPQVWSNLGIYFVCVILENIFLSWVYSVPHTFAA
jgi:hypothetical protein